jgi:hypothetical protein
MRYRIREGDMRPQDFYFVVKKALKSGTLPDLIVRFRADPGLRPEISPLPVIIAPEAYYRRLSGRDSLEHIADITRKTNREVAFAGIIDERSREVKRFIKGRIGDCHSCDWDKGSLLRKARHQAAEMGGQISIGHSHPVFYNEGDDKKSERYEKSYLKKFSDKTSRQILRSGLYRKYGSDYCSMYAKLKTGKLISDFFWILSPRLNQIGVFEIRPAGRVIYHPWIIGE